MLDFLKQGWRSPERTAAEDRALTAFLNWGATLFGVVALELMVVIYLQGAPLAAVAAMGTWCLLILAAGLARGADLSVRLWMFVGGLVLLTISAGLFGATNPGVVLTWLATTFVLSVIFGPSAALLGGLACLLGMLGTSWIAASSASNVLGSIVVDPASSAGRVRTAFAFAAHAALVGLGMSMGLGALIVNLRASLAQARRTLEELEASNRALDTVQRTQLVVDLASGAAHDFNNGLQVIEGWSGLLEASHAGDEEVDEAVGHIRGACTYSAHLARRLLTLGRPEQIGPLAPVELGRVLSDMVTTIRRVIPESIELRSDLGSEAAVAMADVGGLQQVLLNLVINARDAMPEGGELRITLDSDEAGWRLQVADTGVGIPEPNLEQIWEPFFTTKAGAGGTGLGLASTRRIVERMAGSIEVRSVEGEGSVFTVRLPAAEADAQAAGGDRAVSELSPHRILLLEDNPEVREALARRLRADGHEVAEAGRVGQALSLLDASFDVVLTDGLLPDRPVADLIDEARADGVPVIVSSGYLDVDVRAQGADASDVLFLPKPFSIGDFYERLTLTRAPRADGS